MKILAHRHSGILVENFEKMLGFYLGMGFELRRRDREEGAFIDTLLGTKHLILETAKLILKNDSIPDYLSFNLEIIQIVKRHETISSTVTNERFNFKGRSFGFLDIAFTVEDIEDAIEYIIKNGGDVVSKPIKAELGFPALHCYARDPEQNVIHLAENLANVQADSK